ncbi:hypothetical protein [Calothrix sp. UHCC 0171]|uniref:hypothetical protein n=1 Tax=Calothrix sp. UHCC 0171 TaxID=3110245 RepID=UPI002B1FF538|nr:hypothetical protein [Calothrix sp. UHCC 0171]MEA5570879.1 hypothetical protein [Calothrix sp. UHCC 0171]
MNEADTPDNGADKKTPLSENAEQQQTSQYLSCPFELVLPNQNLSNQNSETPKEILKLPSAFSQETPEHGKNDDSQMQSQLESPNINKARCRDSELNPVLTLGNGEWESKTIHDINALEVTQENNLEENVSEDIFNDDVVANNPEISPQDDWVAEPERHKLALIDAEFQQLLALNHELRTANDKLYDRVEELTSKLSDSEKSLQLQQKRYQVTESMLKEQTQELCAVQEQVQAVYQQLENSLQNVQRQETLIETYKTQLEFSQQRLAQLERECSLLQTNHNEQSQQLFQSENACRELRTRLMRQQRQTLQFKAALEKCLENPVGDTEIDNSQDDTAFASGGNHQESPFLRKFKSLFVNAKPIQPWSADVESVDEDVENNKEVILSTPFEPQSPAFPNPREEIQPTTETTPESFFPNSDSPNLESPNFNPPHFNSPSIEEQIDSVIQMFFASQSESKLDMGEYGEISQEELSSLDAVWDTAANNLESNQLNLHKTNNSSDTNTTSLENCDTNDISITPEIVIEPNSQKQQYQEEEQDYWAEVSQLNHLDLPVSESPFHPPNPEDETSPSPVIYPNRPPKGRKSFASVELPKFRPPNK